MNEGFAAVLIAFAVCSGVGVVLFAVQIAAMIREHRMCYHRSHRLRLRCARSWSYGGYCPRHNTTCFHHACEEPS